jgi:hypothetical protein
MISQGQEISGSQESLIYSSDLLIELLGFKLRGIIDQGHHIQFSNVDVL